MGKEKIYRPRYVVGAGYVGTTNKGREVIEFYMQSIKLGARRFDLAHAYLNSGGVRKSKQLGYAIQMYPEYYGEPCPQLQLFSKIGSAHDDDRMGHICPEHPMCPERLEKELSNLEKDYGRTPDVIFMHGDYNIGWRWVQTGCLEWLLAQKTSGRIKQLGIAGVHERETAYTTLDWLKKDTEKNIEVVFINFGIGFDDQIPEVRELRKYVRESGRALMYKKLFQASPPNIPHWKLGIFAWESLKYYPEGYICVGASNLTEVIQNLMFERYYNIYFSRKDFPEILDELRELNEDHVREIRGY